MDDITHISRVKIKRLWGRFDIDWKLNPDVNILAGINGSGKTTILGLIFLCAIGYPLPLYDKYRNIFFDTINVIWNNGECTQEIKNIPINNENNFIFSKFGDIKKYLDIVSTFDQNLKKEKEAEKLSELDDSPIKTELDWEIYKLQEKYLDYQVNIGKEIEKLYKEPNIDYKESINKIYTKLHLFKDTINELFSETDKKLDSENNKISFLDWQDNKLEPYQLSSGEKQLLIILLKILIQNDRPFVMFLDEPEISLHIDWQKKLISKMRALNPNLQLIIATHSPAIIMEGWADKVFEVRDIIAFDRKVKNGDISN